MPRSRSNSRRNSKYSHHRHSNYRDSKYHHRHRRERSRDYDKNGNISENFNYYTKGYSRHSHSRSHRRRRDSEEKKHNKENLIKKIAEESKKEITTEKKLIDEDFLSKENKEEEINEQTKNLEVNNNNNPSLQNTQKKDSNEIDPLDAFFENIEKEAIIQEDQKDDDMEITQEELFKDYCNQDKENENSIIKEENNETKSIEENDNYHKIFMETITNNIIKPDLNKINSNGDVIYNEDINEYVTKSDFISYSIEDDWKRLKISREKIKELKPIDHSKIQYEPFKKNLYLESPEISKLSDSEIEEIRRKNGEIKVRGKKIPKPILNWYNCGLNDTITKILEMREIKNPFPIQMQTIPIIMSGYDCIGIAETGSGKTLAYILPMLRHILAQRKLNEGEGPIALILVPTRELACQIYEEIAIFTKYLKINVSCVYGGSAMGNQINELRRGVEIAVATPGRFIEILSLSKGKIFNLQRVTYVVLDEADRMMDLGFEPQISRILMNIRPDRQTVMFSATFPRQIESLAKKILNKPIEVVIGNRGQTAKNIEQHIEIISRDMSFLRILELLNEYNNTKIIIFCELKDDVIELWKQLNKRKYPCVLLYGGMDQEDRIDSIEKIKNGNAKILISTSLSARGIDIKDCGLVINFNCPNHKEDYIHRIGRTGRAGKKGIAYTFIDPKNEDHLAEDIVRALEMSNQDIPEELKNVVREYKIKLENGETDKYKISGFLGRGYQFNSIEKEKNIIERKLIGSGYDNEQYNENDIDIEQEIEKNKKQLKLLNENSSQALILRGKTLKEKHEEKMRNLRRDKKAQQIAMDIGNNVARAAILTGKSSNEIIPIVQNAMQKALENYKAGVSTKKGVEDASKIIEEWEKEENLKNHIFSIEFEINDYPISTRIKLTRKDYLKQLGENDNVEIIQRGVFVEPGKNIPVGQKKLYLLIKGHNQSNVNAAYSEIKRKFDESALSYYKSSFGYTGNTQRYKV